MLIQRALLCLEIMSLLWRKQNKSQQQESIFTRGSLHTAEASSALLCLISSSHLSTPCSLKCEVLLDRTYCLKLFNVTATRTDLWTGTCHGICPVFLSRLKLPHHTCCYSKPKLFSFPHSHRHPMSVLNAAYFSLSDKSYFWTWRTLQLYHVLGVWPCAHDFTRPWFPHL